MDEFGKAAGASSNFYQRKGLDYNINASKVYEAQVDWVEIRFTEVLMNYGECANEVGKSSEALQVLYDVRKRAGIENTTGNYGITATSQGDIREAYMTERYIEFAYEGKRWNDLRRWKRFDILNEIKYRSSLWLVINDYSVVKMVISIGQKTCSIRKSISFSVSIISNAWMVTRLCIVLTWITTIGSIRSRRMTWIAIPNWNKTTNGAAL